MEEKSIIISGNPVDGFAYFGPFDDDVSAIDWADQQRLPEAWWMASLTSTANA